jgi:hypothetical protein
MKTRDEKQVRYTLEDCLVNQWNLVYSVFAGDFPRTNRKNESRYCVPTLGVYGDFPSFKHWSNSNLLYCNGYKRN